VDTRGKYVKLVLFEAFGQHAGRDKTFKTRLLSLNSAPGGAKRASGAEFTVDILRRERKIRAVRFPTQSRKDFPALRRGMNLRWV